MSHTYKLKGKRYLRLYTPAQSTAAYNAKSDARTIADTMCTLPWTRSSDNNPAVLPVHSGESDESDAQNVATRQSFDACEFCAAHDTKTFRHMVYANSAIYVFKLPDELGGATLSSLSVSVSSDPYNQYGARVALLTNSTGTLPTKCTHVRTGGYWDSSINDYVTTTDYYKAGFAPRTVTTTTDGQTKWLSALAVATFTPSTCVLGTYLYVAVQLESYIERNNFLEGASCLGSDVTVVVSASVPGYDDNDTIDCTTDYATSFKVCEDGVVPDITGSNGGVVAVNVTDNGTAPRLNDDLTLVDPDQIDPEAAPANLHAGLRTAYGLLATSASVAGAISFTNPHYQRYGVGFSVKHSNKIDYVKSAGGVLSPYTVAITASSFMIPFGLPTQFKAQRVTFDWTDWLASHTATTGTKFNFWIHRGKFDTEYPIDILKNVALYDASVNEIPVSGEDSEADTGTDDATGEEEEEEEEEQDCWELLGSALVASGSASFDTGDLEGYVATILVTAYYPPDMVSGTQRSEFWKGTNNFWYNAVTVQANLAEEDGYPLMPGSSTLRNRMVGSEDLCIPDITLLG